MSTLEVKKLAIIEMLGESVEESTLTKILNLLAQPTSHEETSELPKHVIEGISKGRDQIKAGKSSSNEEIKASYKKQFPNANI